MPELWIEILMGSAGVVCLYGNWLVMNRNRNGFLVWIVCNVAWVGYDIHKSAWAQAALMAAYLFLAVLGYVSWSEAKRETKETR